MVEKDVGMRVVSHAFHVCAAYFAFIRIDVYPAVCGIHRCCDRVPVFFCHAGHRFVYEFDGVFVGVDSAVAAFYHRRVNIVVALIGNIQNFLFECQIFVKCRQDGADVVAESVEESRGKFVFLHILVESVCVFSDLCDCRIVFRLIVEHLRERVFVAVVGLPENVEYFLSRISVVALAVFCVSLDVCFHFFTFELDLGEFHVCGSESGVGLVFAERKSAEFSHDLLFRFAQSVRLVLENGVKVS